MSFWPFLFFLAVFAILIGPVGWWYMVKRKQKGLLYYIAAPSVSLLFVLLIVIVNLFDEGIRPRTSCYLADFIDQRVDTALREGAFGVYAPFASGTELRFPTSDIPLWFGTPREHRRHRPPRRQRRGSCKLTFEGNETIVEGLIPTRQPVWVGISSVRNERRRLLVFRHKGDLTVENLLGYSLKDVVIRFEDEYFHMDKLPHGAQRKLTDPSQNPMLDNLNKHLTRRPDRANRLRNLKQRFREDFLKRRASTGKPMFSYIAKRTDGFRKDLWINNFRKSNLRGIVAGVGTPGSANDNGETD